MIVDVTWRHFWWMWKCSEAPSKPSSAHLSGLSSPNFFTAAAQIRRGVATRSSVLHLHSGNRGKHRRHSREVSSISVPNLLTELALSSIVSNKETRKEWAPGTQQKKMLRWRLWFVINLICRTCSRWMNKILWFLSLNEHAFSIRQLKLWLTAKIILPCHWSSARLCWCLVALRLNRFPSCWLCLRCHVWLKLGKSAWPGSMLDQNLSGPNNLLSIVRLLSSVKLCVNMSKNVEKGLPASFCNFHRMLFSTFQYIQKDIHAL